MSLIRCALSFVLLVTLTRAVPLSQSVDVPKNSKITETTAAGYRLSEKVKPSHYKIDLQPDLAAGTFTGTSEIRITVDEKTDEIVLHTKDLTIDDSYTKLIDKKSVKISIKDHAYDNKTERLTLHLSRQIENGDYTLQFNFSGSLLHDDLNGFYRSSYIDSQGQQAWLATTQFEATWARRAFPCFDEPAMKARFNISIVHLDTYTPVSNMPARRREIPDNDLTKWRTYFDETPIMSTYLVAFVISDFKHLAGDNPLFRVYARENAYLTGNYSLSVGPKELAHLENYTDIKHVIAKMDNFAIPHFRAGAMENWGLVTYRESSILFDENATTTEKKQDIAEVISHEFAHQWFGNLVSPLWWDYVWLSEGFANYFQYFTTDKVEPTWRLMDQFVIENLQEKAFVADDNETQHAMDTMVNSPDEIIKIFDNISYSKAGSVIRMISHVLGDADFQSGLRKYLKMQYAAAKSDDLFDSLVEVAPKNTLTKAALQSWAKHPGYPVVTVIRDHKKNTATISQKRFLTNQTTELKETLWHIPINYVTEDKADFGDTMPVDWLTVRNKTITLTGSKENNWVIFNKQQTGYYRVNYDDENWKLIAKYLKNVNNTKIHVLNRAQLLDDSFNLAQANVLPDHITFLEISEYLKDEDDYVPWYAASRAFSVLNKALANTEKHELFKLYVLRLTEKLEKTVGYSENEKDDHIMKLNRLNAIRMTCAMGSAKCLAASHDKLVEHVVGSNKSSPDLRSVVLCAGMRKANATIWEKTYNLAVASNTNENDRSILITALGCSSDATILKSYLEKTLLVASNFTRNDTVKAVYTGSVSGIDVAFDFINNNLKAIIDADGNTESILNYLNEIGSRMTNVAQVNKLEKFIESLPKDKKDLAEALKVKALVSANNNVAWLEKYEPPVSSFLDAQKLIDAKPDKTNLSNISLPSVSLITFMILVAALVTRND